MGCLSRLINQEKSNITVSPIDPLDFLAIVSGPEPQRTLLENLLWTAGKDSNLKFVLIAGIPNNKKSFQIMNNGRMYPHLSAAALVDEINRAEYIICRGGYTTLMEMIPFDKKLILIPTPGQTEQLYLGKLWHENKWALCYNQADFKLSTALAAAANFNFQKPPFAPFSTEALETAIKELSL
jgi:predicted glycosyltransferase